MDKEILVKHLKGLIENYSNEGKEFVLFMLIPVDESDFNTAYSLLISAHWLDSIDSREALNIIIGAIIEEIGSTENPVFRLIARINIINTKDSFVNMMTSFFSVSEGNVTNFSNLNVNGIEIKGGIILVSKRPGQNTNNSKLASM